MDALMKVALGLHKQCMSEFGGLAHDHGQPMTSVFDLLCLGAVALASGHAIADGIAAR